jgi:hypothetical protein
MNDHKLSRGTAFQFLFALMIWNSVGPLCNTIMVYRDDAEWEIGNCADLA